MFYQVKEEYWPEFQTELALHGKNLPAFVINEFMQEQLPRVLNLPFPLRFLFASQPAVIAKVLGIVDRTIATHLAHKA